MEALSSAASDLRGVCVVVGAGGGGGGRAGVGLSVSGLKQVNVAFTKFWKYEEIMRQMTSNLTCGQTCAFGKTITHREIGVLANTVILPKKPLKNFFHIRRLSYDMGPWMAFTVMLYMSVSLYYLWVKWCFEIIQNNIKWKMWLSANTAILPATPSVIS